MSKKPQTSTALKVIKWTEDEWKAVAAHLLQVKGEGLLSSSDFQEVKAKDVFLAQEVLPVERHRKLISISQGFQTMRQRLQDLVQTMELPTRRQSASARALKVKPEAVPKMPAKLVTKEQPGNKPAALAASSPIAVPPAKQKAPIAQKQGPRTKHHGPEANKSPAQAGVPHTSLPRQADQSAQAPERMHNGRRQAHAKPAQESGTGHQPAATATPAPSPAADVPDRAAEPGVVTHSSPAPIVAQIEDQGHGAAQSTMRAKSSPTASAITSTPSLDLVEMVRPFVAMVCQELAAAFVNAIAQRPAGQELSSAVQAAISQAIPAAKPPAGTVGEEERHLSLRHGRPGATAHHPDDSRREPEGLQHNESDEHGSEGDEQPLFDPKLPPSANSSFKPLIGLIGTNIRDLADLQQFYPQLQLTVVSVDAVQGINDLKSCQRIVGVRDEVPAATDEFLRRVFRKRYVRVAGGINRVREQLNAWLDNPNTMKAGAERPWKQTHGKGQGGKGGKQGPKRRPHPPR